MVIHSHRGSKPKKAPLVTPVAKKEKVERPEDNKPSFFIPSLNKEEMEREE